MKKLILMLSVIGLLASSGSALSSELTKDTGPVQPTSSKDAYKQLSIDRFVLSGNSEADYLRIISSSARSVGSDNTKSVKIIWTNKKGADRIFAGLVKKGVDKDQIKLVRNDKRRPLYPIYVEVEQVSAKPMNCKYAYSTAEDFMVYNENSQCATNSNLNIQLKN